MNQSIFPQVDPQGKAVTFLYTPNTTPSPVSIEIVRFNATTLTVSNGGFPRKDIADAINEVAQEIGLPIRVFKRDGTWRLSIQTHFLPFQKPQFAVIDWQNLDTITVNLA